MKPPTQLWILAMLAAVAGCATLAPDRPAERDAGLRLDRGLSALEAGQHPRAFDDLAWVYSRCHGRAAGNRALLALAALELDPRNRAARPELATDLLARALRDPGTPVYARPLVESAYLTGLALGAPAPSDSGPAVAAGEAIPERTDSVEVDTTRTADALGAPAAGAQSPSDRPRAVPMLGRADQENGSEAVYGCGAAVEAEGWVAPRLPALPGPSMATLLTRAEAQRDAAAGQIVTLRAELAAARAELEATRAELERIRETLKP